MTTKTGEKLRGRKRPKGTLAKAWETRRRNAKLKAKHGPKLARAMIETGEASTGPKATRSRSKRDRGHGYPAGPPETAGAIGHQVGTESANHTSQYIGVPQGYSDQGFGKPRANPAEIADKAQKIIKLARGKDSAKALEAVGNHLMMMRLGSYNDGEHEASVLYRKRLLESQQAIDTKIVCGFLAEVDEQMRSHHGGIPPEMTFVVNSYTLVKIVDALNRVGYYANGRKRA